jgi:hypothetical protein
MSKNWDFTTNTTMKGLSKECVSRRSKMGPVRSHVEDTKTERLAVQLTLTHIA